MGRELIRDTPGHRELFNQVIEAGFEVYRLKGYPVMPSPRPHAWSLKPWFSTNTEPCPLSTRFDDWMGIQDNCFSIPVVVGRSGIIRHLYPEMNDDEQQNMRAAAAAVKNTIVSLIPDLVG